MPLHGGAHEIADRHDAEPDPLLDGQTAVLAQGVDAVHEFPREAFHDEILVECRVQVRDETAVRLDVEVGLGFDPDLDVLQRDLESFARLSGYDIVRTRLAGYVPWRLLGLGTLANRLLSVVPLVRWLALVYIAVLRPVVDACFPLDRYVEAMDSLLARQVTGKVALRIGPAD